jgi:hypothetical protein
VKTATVPTLALAIGLLAGCAPAMVQTYQGPPKDRSQIAVLKGIAAEAPGTGRTYYVFFTSYAEFDPARKPVAIKVGDSFTGYPKELTMLPGPYLVVTRCATGNQYAFPVIRINLEAGAEYEVRCEPVPNMLSQVRVIARRIGGPDMRGPASGDKLDDLLPLMK